ncbi:hypothetical protein BGZ98_008468 [Dissophora globulifera]|nr:hypothetical protein BGZ98_008468 [Dissophora globulifera]
MASADPTTYDVYQSEYQDPFSRTTADTHTALAVATVNMTQQQDSSSPVSTASTPPSSNGSSASALIQVTPEFKKASEDTIRGILERLQAQQDELGFVAVDQDTREYVPGTNTDAQRPWEQSSGEALESPHTLRQHHGDANLRHF